MKKTSLIDNYLWKYSAEDRWKLIANDTGNISQVVVIPACAEKESLFLTLASLSQNPPASLEYSFILCVINNKDNFPPAVIEDNRQTIECLDALIKRNSMMKFKDKTLQSLVDKVAAGRLKLGYIDASSAGNEIPREAGGVGMARKIGMDMALKLLRDSSSSLKLIISLDADTLVSENYLSVIRNHFSPHIKTAIIAYEHQLPEIPEEKAAIVCYEIFLRYWVLALKYAKSPWAFHSIGSTIVTTTESYLNVRGMNKREAGEDFYFLNKLAKTGKIHYIRQTCVYPSARPSNRVPFGTGKRIQRFLSGNREDEYVLYDPQIFKVLAEWLQFMNESLLQREDEIMDKAKQIHPLLDGFLIDNKFPLIWSKIRRNAKDEKTLSKQFKDWFDGFKTLKLINYFSREVYPCINMFEALAKIFSVSEIAGLNIPINPEIPEIEEQIKILRYLRTIT
jgi:hypothetical protein